VRINVLGTIEVIVGGRAIRLPGQRQRALLAALALQQGRAVAVGWLVDVLWDTIPPPTARAKIHSHVSGLRQALGDGTGRPHGPVVTQPPGYALRCEGVELDLAAFDVLAARAEKASAARQPDAVSEMLADALALWRGHAFADVESQLIRGAADKLDERRLLAIEAKAEADLAMGCWSRVVAELSPWLAAHPFRERMRAMLMLALYRSGCRAGALESYRTGHELMVAELGLEPGPQLRELHRQILTDDPVVRAPSLSAASVGQARPALRFATLRGIPALHGIKTASQAVFFPPGAVLPRNATGRNAHPWGSGRT
jgi:DNA-binding SARP family transcriptional activator